MIEAGVTEQGAVATSRSKSLGVGLPCLYCGRSPQYKRNRGEPPTLIIYAPCAHKRARAHTHALAFLPCLSPSLSLVSLSSCRSFLTLSRTVSLRQASLPLSLSLSLSFSRSRVLCCFPSTLGAAVCLMLLLLAWCSRHVVCRTVLCKASAPTALCTLSLQAGDEDDGDSGLRPDDADSAEAPGSGEAPRTAAQTLKHVRAKTNNSLNLAAVLLQDRRLQIQARVSTLCALYSRSTQTRFGKQRASKGTVEYDAGVATAVP